MCLPKPTIDEISLQLGILLGECCRIRGAGLDVPCRIKIGLTALHVLYPLAIIHRSLDIIASDHTQSGTVGAYMGLSKSREQ